MANPLGITYQQLKKNKSITDIAGLQADIQARVV